MTGADEVGRAAFDRAEAGDEAGAWALVAGIPFDVDGCRVLADVAGWSTLDRSRRLELGKRLFEDAGSDERVLASLGEATASWIDHRFLNAAPPDDPFFEALAQRLVSAWETSAETLSHALANGLTVAARTRGRAWDDVCERAHRALIAARPDRWEFRYDYGLFLKTRGRFEDGLLANQQAARGGGSDNEAVRWNLAICATGAGRGELALEVWRELGMRIELGDDGLPTGPFPYCQVRLAERPLAARGAQRDDPGREETIWIERISPCHGRVVSALTMDLGVDYGDLVLHDGASIVTRLWGDDEVPVFPHLVTLRAGGWRTYWFAGTQAQPGQMASFGERLPGGASLYVHTEMTRTLCAACWGRRDGGHTHDAPPSRVVTGKLVVPPDTALAEVGMALASLAPGGHPQVAVPGLWSALGEASREAVDEARYALLVGSR